MTLNVDLHDVIRAQTNHYTHDNRRCATVTFSSKDGEIQLFVPPDVADAIKVAFDESMARHEAGRIAAYRAREMNAELPDDVREVMQLKGMI